MPPGEGSDGRGSEDDVGCTAVSRCTGECRSVGGGLDGPR